MAQYNRWMNQKIYTICAEIPNAKRNKDLGAFFKSIDGTLNHILIAGHASREPKATYLVWSLYSESFCRKAQ